MEDFLPIVFAVSLLILTIVLAVVGIQLIAVLNELKKTLVRVNTTIDTVENKVNAFANPLQNLGGAVAGLKTGMQFFEAFTSWIHRDKDDVSDGK